MTGTCINSRDISFRVVTEVERKLNEVGGVYFFFFKPPSQCDKDVFSNQHQTYISALLEQKAS